FENELPDSTTFIINIGTQFSDLHGNSLKEPVKIAVSTGPEINKGKIIGRIFDARTGETRKGERVLLYRLPVDFMETANYISETDTSGTVRFRYLSPGDYIAFWVDDRNRNGVWDKESERAQPFGKETISLKKEASDSLGALFIAKSDTSNPVINGIGLFSSKRLRLRFNEDIELTDSTKVSVTDTLGAAYSDAFPLYIMPDQRYILFVRSQKDLKKDQSYQLKARNIADKAGNILKRSTSDFTGSSQSDTTEQRIIYAAETEGIYPEEGIKVTYAKPISNSDIRDSVIVVTADTAYTGWKHLRIQENNLWVMPDNRWQKGIDYEIRVWNPLFEDFKKVKPNIWFESNLGALDISLPVDSTSGGADKPAQLLLKRADGELVADTAFTDSITIEELAPVSYRLTIFKDLNNNDKWDSGQIDPYTAPEPYFVQNNISVEPGFTGEVTVEFKNVPQIGPSEIKPDSSSTDSSFVPLHKQK